MNKQSLSRRKFIKTLFSTLILISGYGLYSKKKSFAIDPNLKNDIKLYNSKRKSKLKTNLDLEIKEDLINNNTIWINKRLYTYAEIYNL